MIQILDLAKYFFIASCIVLVFYKLAISIILFSGKDPFNEEKKDYLDAEEKEQWLKYFRIAGYILFSISVYFMILYAIPV